MEIKFNKDKTVTINATESEYSVIASTIVSLFNNENVFTPRSYYGTIVDAIHKAYIEQVALRLDEEL